MDDVVGAAREVVAALVVRDDVEGRCHEVRKRRRNGLVVPQSAEWPDIRHGRETSSVSAIATLAADRVVEGVYAVARKERKRTRTGAPYLALELVDPSGRIEARVWADVELLDRRFGEGDAIRVLGRVERFRDRLQLDVRSLETAAGADPVELAPALRRDAAELDGFFEFLAGEIAHPGLRSVVDSVVNDGALRAAMRALPAAETHHAYAGGLLEHTIGVATLCRDAAQLHPRLRADLLLAAALVHDVGRVRELE